MMIIAIYLDSLVLFYMQSLIEGELLPTFCI